MSSKVNISDPSILQSYKIIWDPSSENFGWMILGYAQKASIGIKCKGFGIKSFVEAFSQKQEMIQFGYIRHHGNGLYLIYVSAESIDRHDGFVTVTSLNEITEETIQNAMIDQHAFLYKIENIQSPSTPKVNKLATTSSVGSLVSEDSLNNGSRPKINKVKANYVQSLENSASNSTTELSKEADSRNSIQERRSGFGNLKISIFKKKKPSMAEGSLSIESLTKVGTSSLEKKLGISLSPKPDQVWDESEAFKLAKSGSDKQIFPKTKNNSNVLKSADYRESKASLESFYDTKGQSLLDKTSLALGVDVPNAKIPSAGLDSGFDASHEPMDKKIPSKNSKKSGDSYKQEFFLGPNAVSAWLECKTNLVDWTRKFLYFQKPILFIYHDETKNNGIEIHLGKFKFSEPEDAKNGFALSNEKEEYIFSCPQFHGSYRLKVAIKAYYNQG